MPPRIPRKASFHSHCWKVGLARVGIVYAHDLQADVIDFMASVCQGIVLAGVGDGNATDAAIAA